MRAENSIIGIQKSNNSDPDLSGINSYGGVVKSSWIGKSGTSLGPGISAVPVICAIRFWS